MVYTDKELKKLSKDVVKLPSFAKDPAKARAVVKDIAGMLKRVIRVAIQ